MPLYVGIYTVEAGQSTLAGVISLEGDGLNTETQPGNEGLLEKVIRTPVMDLKTRQTVTSSTNPERWIRSLCHQFRSAYLYASSASLIKPGTQVPGTPPPTSMTLPPTPQTGPGGIVPQPSEAALDSQEGHPPPNPKRTPQTPS